MTCTACPLHEKAGVQFLNGEGPSPCDVLLVSDYPSPTDVREETIMSDEPGSLLRAAIKECGDLSFRITYVVRCPLHGDKPGLKEKQTCVAEHLLPEIEASKPSLIVAMGATALHALTGERGVLSLAGKTLTSPHTTIPVLAIAHPSYVVREDSYMQRWLRHVWAIPAMVRKGNLGNYRLLTERSEVRKALNEWATSDAAFDYETTGLNPRAGKVISVAVTGACHEAVVFDPNKFAFEWKSFLRAKGRRIVHNLSFEFAWTAVHFGIELKDVWDTKIFAMLQDENHPTGLKPLALELTDIGNYAHGVSEEIGNEAWAKKTIEEVWRYNAADADATFRIYRIQRDLLSDAGTRQVGGANAVHGDACASAVV